MKKEYASPIFEYLEIKFIKDALNVSDPDPGVNTGGGSEQSAESDPFGDW